MAGIHDRRRSRTQSASRLTLANSQKIPNFFMTIHSTDYGLYNGNYLISYNFDNFVVNGTDLTDALGLFSSGLG